MKMRYYPAYLDLTGKKVIVVGAGAVARRKISVLLSAGADVSVVSPDIPDGTSGQGLPAEVRWHKKRYEAQDIRDAFIVIAATDDLELNRKIARDAKSANVLVNVVAPPEESNFIVPSVLCRGDLLLSISTSGKAPAISKRIRKELQKQYGHEYELLLDIMGKVKKTLQQKVASEVERAEILARLAGSDLPAMLKNGNTNEVIDEVCRIAGFEINLDLA